MYKTCKCKSQTDDMLKIALFTDTIRYFQNENYFQMENINTKREFRYVYVRMYDDDSPNDI